MTGPHQPQRITGAQMKGRRFGDPDLPTYFLPQTNLRQYELSLTQLANKLLRLVPLERYSRLPSLSKIMPIFSYSEGSRPKY
jgi:hypothetical protein